MNKPLRAVVIGAGWAGEGHTRALQYSDVNVVAISARNQAIVRNVADKVGVPEASTDWRRTLMTVKPDIVALATPANLRGEVVELAAELGCHLLCDKPLATTAQEAKRLWQTAVHAGVKHAYAASQYCSPSVAWLAELVQSNTIGTLLEIDGTLRRSSNLPLSPWSWMSTLEAGGGTLNNSLPHHLAIFQTITGGQLLQVQGEARTFRTSAPFVPEFHDFRTSGANTPTPEEAEKLEWRSCDSDNAFTGLFRFSSKSGEDVSVALRVNFTAIEPVEQPYLRFYGTEGTLIARGFGSYSVSILRKGESTPVPLAIPQRIIDEYPQVADDVQNKWCAFVREFIADVRGEQHKPYLTFYEGWRYQEAIDAIRSGRGWSYLDQS